MKSNMKTQLESMLRVGALAVLLATPPGMQLRAEDAKPVRYEAQSTGSKVSMEGTSTLHDWTMDTVMVGGYLEADAKFPESALTDPKAAKPVLSVFMPVRSFKSGKASMDSRMQKEMNEPQFKRIEYKLIELKPKSAAGTTGALQFDAVGALTIVGKTLTNTMPVTIEKLADGKLKVVGSSELKMTDYGIKPPTTLGLFSTGDELKLKFEWLAAPKAP
jgi:polyisoprenoid-binding protein YceI